MIKKVYWYCPMCNYSTDNQPIGTACKACGHDNFAHSAAHKPKLFDYTLQQKIMEPSTKDIIKKHFWELLS